MSYSLDRAHLDAFRELVAVRLGLQFDDDKLDRLAEVAAQRLEATGRPPFDVYIARLASGADPEELRAVAQRLTVGETYFFRNRNDLEAFVHVVLPDRMRSRGRDRRLRILSAGCSSGEEPYTLAMLVRDIPALEGWDVQIHGVDVNPAAIARATAALYGEWSLRQTPPAARARFFREEGRSVRVAEEVRALVTLEERNLIADDRRFWEAGAWDVVFCRNVTMYFAPDVTRRVIGRIAGALAPGGYLFLGHAETLRGVSQAFHLRHSHDTFYYQVRGPGDGAEVLVPGVVAHAPAGPARAAPREREIAVAEGGWAEAIRRSSERIADLTGRAAAGALAEALAATASPAATSTATQTATATATAIPTAIPTPTPADPLPRALASARAFDLLREERFTEALAALGAPALDRDTDQDALLLRAVLLTVSGDPREAERVCSRLFELDELNAEAHYVMALCREHARDRAGAVNHDQYALYLDPTFAMPRLHLGLMASRAGQPEAARRELARALVLLSAEDGSRILLLGGGFTREALVALCRAELRACGGAA